MAINQETIAAIEALFEKERERNEEARKNFWVAPEKHFLHHRHLDRCMQIDAEHRANHEFISTIRGAGGEAGRKAFQGIVWATVILVGVAAWSYVKASISGGK